MYVGGGNAGLGSDNKYIVMTYDISTGKWSTLPSYRARDFAMTAINNQLVLVGGRERGNRIKVLGLWDADNKQWTHPFPEMHTERSSCSAVVYNEWLVVAGGVPTHGAVLSSVEVMNIESKQWYTGPQTCVPWYMMKTAIVGDECYFIGGYTSIGGSVSTATATTNVYSVSLPYLISKLESDERDGQVWKEISGLQTTRSTPFSISGSLLAVGGRENMSRKAVTAIHLYQPDTGEWVKIGDLLTPRYNVTCDLLLREIVVVGGFNDKPMKTMDIAKLK